MDFEKVLQRIGYDGEREVTLEVMAAMQLSFLLNVPFENLDIHWGRPIAIDSKSIYKKMVEGGRGGFCYECNGLLYDALSHVGFDLDFVAATMRPDRGDAPDDTHMIMVAHLDGDDYVVDVGNGQSCRVPMKIGSDKCYICEGVEYQLGHYEGKLALYEKKLGQDWRVRYSFVTQPRERMSFVEACEYNQHSDESQFRKYEMATLATTKGRKTLVGQVMVVMDGFRKKEWRVETREEIDVCLEEHFGIKK